MKAVDYMDQMDVFGYRWLPGYEGEIVGSFMIAELKKDKATGDDISQVMRYVDWVCETYTSGDYSMVEAFLVAHSFDLESINNALDQVARNYVVGVKPPKSVTWNSLVLATYGVDGCGHIAFEELESAANVEL